MVLAKKMFLFFIFLSFMISGFVFFVETESRKDRLGNVISLYSERIINEMQRAVYATEVLKEITRAGQGHLSLEDFNALAKAVGEGISYITIQYMKDGIVMYAYPLEGNEGTIGHNVLLADTTSMEAQKAMQENKFTVSGPFDLLQGMKGLAIRNPLYIEGDTGTDFWGFITIVLPVPEALKNTGVFELESLGYQYRLTATYKNEDIIFAESSEFNTQHAVENPIVIGENTWKLLLYRQDDAREVFVYVLLLTFAFILFSVILFYILRRVEKRLNNDLLTGAFNRRLLENYIKPKFLQSGFSFTLFYIDLNDFKPVNDNYGHEMGDLLLIAFVKRLQGNIKSDGLIYRIGGDEFVIITPNIKQDKAIKDVISRISNLSKKTFVLQGKSIHISASIGYSCFPQDGQDIKTLLQVADEKMYDDKQAYKKANGVSSR